MLTNLRIGGRLSVGFGTALIAMLAVLILAFIGMARMNASTEALVNQRVALMQAISDIKYGSLTVGKLVSDTALVPSTDNVGDALVKLIPLRENNRKTMAQITKLSIASDEKTALAKINTVNDAYKVALNNAISGLNSGDRDLLASRLRELVEPQSNYYQSLDELSTLEAKEVHASVEQNAALYRNIRLLLAIIAVAALVIVAAVAMTISRSIIRPLGEAAACADAIAQGDLTYPIKAQGRDEVAAMMRSLEAAVVQISQIVGRVKTAASHITVASAELAQGNADLSQRTEEQAASLQETAASMEQLTSTVRHNSDNARQASQLAEGAARIANEGATVVSGVASTMQTVDGQSKKVADIVGIIDSIAFQTNILALNAAVEAARAGEQGRGFAVVAGEVRTLAQRSAASAREIKELIEKTVSGIGDGVDQVTQAQSTMGQMSNAVRRVTDIMGEISAASSEQSNGIEQVNRAVVQMDEVTQQNAALVEQAAAAAQSLARQADELSLAVAVFRTEAGAGSMSASMSASSDKAEMSGATPAWQPMTA
ncbi:methyl-accepting chemotaxis protein [Robbsia sp. KACC 23696]|uniref:methyl-accepting chemotaxis protein n=1 Tax=Robbsia sp. KACC 23696 TaxID=3149231 RepID=UPI00325AA720